MHVASKPPLDPKELGRQVTPLEIKAAGLSLRNLQMGEMMRSPGRASCVSTLAFSTSNRTASQVGFVRRARGPEKPLRLNCGPIPSLLPRPFLPAFPLAKL